MDLFHTAIIGGGISGLSTAYELFRLAAREKVPLKIALFEARDRFGGVIRTVDQKPFIMEAAADAFFAGGSRGPEIAEFCDSLGLSGDLVEASSSFRRFFILKEKSLISLPNSFAAFDPFALFLSPLLGFSAKARLLLEPWIPRRRIPGDESIGHFLRRRLGAAFYREAVRPVVRGVYMADPEDLSLEAVFPGLGKREQIYGSLTNAALAGWFKKNKSGPDRFLNFKNGLGSLTGALVRELSSCELRVSSPVHRWGSDAAGNFIIPEGGKTFRADAVCLAMNATDAAPLLKEADPVLSRDLAGIRYDSILTFSFIFKTADLPRQTPGPGFIVPASGEIFPFSSLKWFDLPGGTHRGLRVFISEAMLPEIFREDDGTVKTKILRELKECFGIQSAPEFVMAERYPKALPRYEVGHNERIAGIEAGLQKHPGLFLTGNGFRGFGITDCIHAAKAAARKILTYCQRSVPTTPSGRL